MRRLLLSFFLQCLNYPALGVTSGIPARWLYGDSKVTPLAKRQENARSLTLQLKAEAISNNDKIYVSDIAECTGNPLACNEVMGVEVIQSPKPGQETRVSLDILKKIIFSEIEVNDVEIVGASPVLIKSPGLKLPMDLIQETLEGEWSQIDFKGVRFVISSIKVPSYVHLRNNLYRFRFTDLNEAVDRLKEAPRRSSIALQVEAESTAKDSSERIKFAIYVQVRAEVLAAVSNSRLDKGSTISQENIAWKWIPYQERVIVSMSDLEGRSPRRTILADQALKEFDLIKIPDIRRGERVDASISSSGVTMASGGQALESGSIGQKIRVQLDITKRQVYGVIVAKSKVEVSLQ